MGEQTNVSLLCLIIFDWNKNRLNDSESIESAQHALVKGQKNKPKLKS